MTSWRHAHDALGIPWERPAHRPIRQAVPRSVKASDCPVLAAWIATPESLRDHELAKRVICRFPNTDAMAREYQYDKASATAALQALRAGQPADTATVVRLARHRLETE